MSKAVFCLCDTESQAEIIVNNLKNAGALNNDISVLFPDKGGTRDFAHEQHTKAPEGAAAGAGAGGTLGGIMGWLVGVGSLAIPGVGPFNRSRSDYSRTGWGGSGRCGWRAFRGADRFGNSRI